MTRNRQPQLVLLATWRTPTQRPKTQVSTAARTASGMAGSVQRAGEQRPLGIDDVGQRVEPADAPGSSADRPRAAASSRTGSAAGTATTAGRPRTSTPACARRWPARWRTRPSRPRRRRAAAARPAPAADRARSRTGSTTSVISAAWTTSGASSLSDLPIRIAGRRSGLASTRSYEPRRDLEQQVGPGRPGAEQADHHDHPGQEPLQRRRAAERGRIDRAGQQRPEQAEEDQRLDQREDHRERIAQHQRHLAEEDRPDVGEHRAAGLAGRLTRGGHAATSLSSRRLRPVRLRKTSSRVGTRTSAASTSTPA